MNFYGLLRTISHKDSEVFSFTEPKTIPDFLNFLANLYGDKFSNLIFNKDGTVLKDALVLINEVPHPDLDKLLADRDEVTILLTSCK